jgi:antitoxin (DNA-binding transcriptional repressor) of toxin-antitoxin stability system
METTITATELASRLTDVLSRVQHRGERFVVQQNGETIATIVLANQRPALTVRELIARVGDLPFPGDGFGDDLESIQAAQEPAEMPEWPD